MSQSFSQMNPTIDKPLICWLPFAGFVLPPFTTFLQSICVDYRQITKMNMFMSIIDTKCVLACRKEGWASESKNDNDNAVFLNYGLLDSFARWLLLWRIDEVFIVRPRMFCNIWQSIHSLGTNFVTQENKPRL